MIGSSFPPEHKKRFLQAVGAWALVVVVSVILVRVHAADTLKDWQSRVPQVTADIRTTYLTPQITETAAPDFADASTAPEVQITPDTAYISIIMSGIGISEMYTDRAIEDLPPEVALAFSPYSHNLSSWLKKAQDDKRETLIMIPMDSVTYPKDDPGPLSLLTRLSDNDNKDHLYQILSGAKGVIGAINDMGDHFLSDSARLLPVFAALRQRGTLFVETPSATPTLAKTVAGKAGLPYLAASLNLDADAAQSAISQQLLDLEKTAKTQGYAVGIATPYPVSFNTIKKWAETLDRRGVKLVPLTTLWKVKSLHDEKEQPEHPAAPGKQG